MPHSSYKLMEGTNVKFYGSKLVKFSVFIPFYLFALLLHSFLTLLFLFPKKL